MGAKHFDHIIRNKLNDATHQHGTDWHAFEKILDKKLPQINNSGTFDHIISTKISKYAKTSIPNWEKMNELLEQHVKADQKQFDNIIFQKLKQTKLRASPNWTAFLYQLKNEEQLQKNIISTRILEAFVLILLLMMSYGNQKIQQEIPEKNHSVIAAKTQVQKPSTIQIKTLTTTVEKTKDYKAPTPANSTSNQRLIKDTPKENLWHQIVPRTAQLDNPKQTLPPTTKNTAKQKIIARKNPKQSQQLSPIARLESLPISRLRHAKAKPKSINTIKKTRQATASKAFFDNSWTMGIHTGMALHLISTPEDHTFQINAFDRFNSGYLLGINFYRQVGLLNLSLGLRYQYLSYTPPNVTIIQGSLTKRGFEKFKHTRTVLQFAEFPLNLNFDIKKTAKMRWYAGAGVTTQIVAQASYRFEVLPQPDPANSFFTQPASLTSEPFTKYTTTNNFSKGALEGGGLKLNSFNSAQINFGLDYTLDHRQALFFNISYRHPIDNNTIGPNSDRFFTTGFDIGYKFVIDQRKR